MNGKFVVKFVIIGFTYTIYSLFISITYIYFRYSFRYSIYATLRHQKKVPVRLILTFHII